MTEQDHDLLIRVDENLRQVRVDLQELKDDTKVRMVKLEARVALLENWRWYVVGIATALAAIVQIAINKYS